MTIHTCPRCNRRFTISEGTGETDFEHKCNSGNPTLDNEDVVAIGDWEDYTGSGKVQNVLLQGAENELKGTVAGLEGEDKEALTKRGKRKATHRSRQHIQYINFRGFWND
ncbi:MAG: hypothetical protein ACTSXD_05060 [Candidatus Heimdallarchaeaceae archaeon]